MGVALSKDKWTEIAEKGTLWWRTSSRETRSLPLHKLFQSIVLDPAAAAQILSWAAGGKNSGIVGLWDCGEIAISEISGFFMFFLI